MIEGVAMVGNRFLDEWIVGTADAVPIVVMGALPGHVVSGDGPRARAAVTGLARHVGVLATFAALFVVGRLGLPLAGVIDAALVERPGVTIGVFHGLLADSVAQLAPAPRTSAFGLVTLACLLVDTCGRFPVGRIPGSRGHTRAPVG